MAIIKCKMCGGDVELATDKTFGTCEFCGCSMTFPKVDDEQRAAAFNRGNHFRRIGEFDKALAVYERIVREDDTDAEAHWCCALCRFGIEYVEDPATFEYLPTCHRASFDSFLEDVDYLAAVEHSEGITKRQYQKDGAKIAEVQRGILATSQNEEPFDVFICYKESDESGQRTRDSLMAQDVYYQLTDQGYRVFFSRITLEDMAGKQYEPYIFAALNSAKVMIVIGTKPEYMNAVWVKNEWSRFLAMMKKDRHKLLLPCYRDMDPYDMPEQLSVLQSYDMAKIGFIQDLIRGIKKVLDADEKPETVKETVVVQQTTTATPNIAPLLERAFMFLEDGDWTSANEYCEKVLDIEPKCAEAYLGKLMAVLRVKNQANLKDQAEPFDRSNHYQKALRFADEVLKKELIGYIEHINIRNENARLEGVYKQASDVMLIAKTENTFQEASRLFETIPEYKNSAELAKECLAKAEDARKDAILADGKAKMKDGSGLQYEAAIRTFKTISGWKDADEKVEICQQKLAQIKEKAESDRLERERKYKIARAEAAAAAKKRKKRNTVIAVCAAVLALAVVFIYCLVTVIIPNNNYNTACVLMEQGKYEEAIVAFELLSGYKDSTEQIAICKQRILQDTYHTGLALLQEGKYDEAYATFESLGDYSDSAEQCKEVRYQCALYHWEKQEYEISNPIFQELGSYKDSRLKIHKHIYTSITITVPACETEGEERLTCNSCPHSYMQAIKATGHHYGQPQITKAATCTTMGEKKSVCDACGKETTEKIAMLDHSYSGTVTKAATCEEDGVKTFTCGCGKSYTETINKTGHSYNGVVTTAATCEEDGVKTFTCHCGKSYKETIKAIGHNYSQVTCTAASVCANCNHTKQAALGHEDNGKTRCSRCNANLTTELSVVLEGETSYMLYESFKWQPAGDAYYRMTVKVLEIMPTDNTTLDPMFHVEYDDDDIKKENVKAGDVFTLDFYVYNHTAQYHDRITWKAQSCIIEVTIEIL